MEANRLPGIGAAERVGEIYRGNRERRRQTGGRSAARKRAEDEGHTTEADERHAAPESGGRVNIRA